MMRHAISSSVSKGPSGLSRALLPLSVACCLLFTVGCSQDGSGETDFDAPAMVEVKKGPLSINVTEGGDLESGSPVSIRSEVEGRNAIIQLVPEGSYVKEGELLAKLDSAGLDDNINRQNISADKARSDYAQAQESLAIQMKRNQENLIDAQTKRSLAERALKGYLEGRFPLEKRRAESDLTLAKERLKRAEFEASASERLYKKEIISKAQLEADRLSMKQNQEGVEIAKRELTQLIDWTSKDEIQRLRADIDVKKLAEERVKQQAQSELKQQKDLVATRKRNLDLEEERLEKLKQQFSKCTIYAPRSGLVVYGRQKQRRGSDEPISLGKEVREREELIQMPDLNNMVVEVDIHESAIKKVEKGQRCWVKVDALPGQSFPGTVVSVGLVPSSQSSWLNPDLKVYETKVRLDQTVEGMKPGMHAQVKIMVDELKDALTIPQQCVVQSGNRTFAYMASGDSVELREVEVGVHNDSVIEIKSGLNEGDLVYMARPSGAPALPEPEKQEFQKKDPSSAAAGGAGKPGGAGRGGARRTFDDGNLPSRPKGAAGAKAGGGRPGGKMSPEARKAMMEKFKNMSPEEKAEMRKKWAGGGGKR